MAQLSDDAVRQLAEMIDREARDWARDWIAARKATLEKRKIKASGELISSIQSSARMTLESAVTNIVEIAFAEQGRFVDMKRLDVPGGGADYISNLAAWIQRKGLLAKYRAAFLIRNRRKKNLRTCSTACPGQWLCPEKPKNIAAVRGMQKHRPLA